MSRKQHTAHDDVDHLLSCLERIEGHLEQEGADRNSLLPDADVLLRVARREYKTIDPEPTRAHQQVLENVVKLLAEKVSPKEGSTLALGVVQDAIHATEELALRAGYFVGLARGMAWTAQRGVEALDEHHARGKGSARKASGRNTKRAGGTLAAKPDVGNAD